MNYDQSAMRARAIDYSRQGIVISDASQPDNPIVDINPAFEVMTGYSRDEIIGRNCRFLQSPDSDQPERSLIRQAMIRHEHIRVEIKNYRKDGSMFWNELTISPVYTDGILTNYIGIQQDITDRKIMVESLINEKDKLAQYNEILEVQTQQQRSIDERINRLLQQSGYTSNNTHHKSK
jgi:PAS domain S-box-containing protein